MHPACVLLTDAEFDEYGRSEDYTCHRIAQPAVAHRPTDRAPGHNWCGRWHSRWVGGLVELLVIPLTGVYLKHAGTDARQQWWLFRHLSTLISAGIC